MIERYDVVVAGGGSAGVSAAIGAARAGAQTVVIEHAGFLGGASTNKNVNTYCGLYTLARDSRQAVLGVAEDVLQRLRARDALAGPFRAGGVYVTFDGESVKRVLDELCAEAGVEVLLHGFVSGAARDGDHLRKVAFVDHGGTHEIEGAAFVDATGDCDLAFLAGASTRYGNHGIANLGSLSMRVGGIPADVTVSTAAFATAIEAAKRRGVGPISKTKGELIRLPISGDLSCYLPSVDYDPRSTRSMSEAEACGRQQAWVYLGILRTLPGCGCAYLVSTGPEFGTRESRHIEARRQLTWNDVVKRRPTDDCVALGAWGVEWHDRKTNEGSFLPPPDGAAYEIPLDCIISRDTPNLFAAGRTADADRQAGASLRVMGTAFATGQAAGVAAALLADTGQLVSDDIRSTLRNQGALIDIDEIARRPIVKMQYNG